MSTYVRLRIVYDDIIVLTTKLVLVLRKFCIGLFAVTHDMIRLHINSINVCKIQ